MIEIDTHQQKSLKMYEAFEEVETFQSVNLLPRYVTGLYCRVIILGTSAIICVGLDNVSLLGLDVYS
jgi:hypothetical protein